MSENTKVAPAVDTSNVPESLSNPRETQSIIALEVVTGFYIVDGLAAVAAIMRGGDPTPYVTAAATLAIGVVGFYFGSKKSATE